MANAFDQFDAVAVTDERPEQANPFDAFDQVETRGSVAGLQSVEQETPATPEPTEAAQDRSVLKDIGALYGMGSGQLLSGAGWLFGSDTLSRLGRETAEYWEGKLSNVQREAGSKRFIEDDFSLGEAVSDPNSWMGVVVQSLPAMVPGIGAAGVASRGVAAAGMGKGAAAAAGAAAGSTAEGAVIGGMVGEEVFNTVVSAPEEQISQSPFYQDLLRAGEAPEVAREKTAEKAAQSAALPAGVGGAILGIGFNKFVSDAVTGNLTSRLTKETARGAAIEGATEASQSALEAGSTQRALKEHIDQPYDLAGAANQIAAGTGAGVAMGAGVGAAGAASSRDGQALQSDEPAAASEGNAFDQFDQAEPEAESRDWTDEVLKEQGPSDTVDPAADYDGRPEWANERTNIFRDGVEPEPPVVDARAEPEVTARTQPEPQRGPATETPTETGQAADDLSPFERNQLRDAGVTDEQLWDMPTAEARRQLEAAKSANAGPSAQQSEAPDLTESGTGVFRVPVDRINVDPQQYQFRSRVNDQGVDKRLDGVKQWDDKRAGNVLLHRREDGSLYVADGHHRVDLARRLGQSELNARIVSEADGIDVATARVEAAMNNIADGKAEPLDVAKVFRDSGTPVAEVRSAFNLPNSQITRDGEALANLSDNVFGMVSSGQMTEKDGAAIGASFTEAGQQEAAADAFQKVQPETEYQRQLLVNEIRAAEFAESQGEQGGLFGDDPQEVSLMQDRLKVLDALRQRLNSDKRLFKSLNDNADRAGEAGNRIATEANEQITERSARSLDLISRVTTTPALNEMVNRAARRVYDGENRSHVVKDLKQELMSYEQGKIAESSRRPATASRVRADAEQRQEPGAGQPVPEQDTARTDPQGQPESGQQEEVTPSLELESQTEAQLAEQARTQQEAEQADAAQRRQDEQRAAADEQVDGFTLTGSDRTADVAMAAGQQDLLAQAAAETDTNPTDAQKEAGDAVQMLRESGGVSYYRVNEDQLALDFNAEPEPDAETRNVQSRQGDNDQSQQTGDAGRRTARVQAFQRARQIERQSYLHGLRSVTNAAEAAHVLAPFRKDAHETMLALVLDSERRPLAIVRHSKGTVDGAAVYPSQLLADIATVPGADAIWLSHNHPSGTMTPSKADIDLTNRLKPMLKDAEIALEGHVIIGFGRAHTAFDMSERSNGGEDVTVAARRQHRIPVLERQLVRRANTDIGAIRAPADATRALRSLADKKQTGLLLLDNRHSPVGFLDLTGYDLEALREEGAYRQVLEALAKTNAAGGIIQAGDGVDNSDNLQRMIASLNDFRLLDAVHTDTLNGAPVNYGSVADRGAMQTGGAWFSRDGEYRMSPEGQMDTLTVQEAESIRDELMQDWKGAPEVIIRDSISEFPPGLQAEIYKAGAQNNMRGVLWRDTVYLLASRIPDRMRMEQVVLHEVIGHYGLRKMLGKDMERVLNQIWMTHGGQTRAKYIIDRYFPDGFDVNNKEHRHIVAEELIAHLAEQNRGQTLVQRAVAIIREGLRKLGFTLEFTVDDIVNLLRRSRQTVERGGFEVVDQSELSAAPASRSAQSGESRFSRTGVPDLDSEPSNQTDLQARQSSFMKGFATQPLDRMFRALFDVAGLVDAHGRLKPGVKISETAERVIKEWRPAPAGRFQWLDTTLETARHGLLDRYKLSDDYKMEWRKAEAYGRNIDMQAMDILKTLEERGVKGTEAAVLQKILTGEPVENHQMQAVAAPILRAIDELGQSAVEYGIITREQFERNRGEYLHRSYLRHERDFTGLGKFIHNQQRKQNRKIKGDTAKGRGIQIRVNTNKLMQHIPVGWYGVQKKGGRPDMQLLNGQKFKMLEDPGVVTESMDTLEGVEPAEQQRSRGVVFWPADKAVPARYDAWRSRGTFEVRGRRGKNVTLWRDYSKAERQHMGEILDARYNIAKTFQLMSKDLAMGKFFHDVAQNPEWFQREAPPSDSVLTASEARSLRTLSKADWVHVPDTLVSQSAGTKQWGALADGYVRAEIWRDLNELDKMHNPGMWRKILTQWKLNKTARSPVVHMNNVMSNLVLMDLADVRVTDLYKGIRSYRAKDQHWRAAQEYGAFEGTFINEEIRRQVLDPILDELTKQDMDADTSPEGTLNSLSKMAYSIWTTAKKFDNAMTNFYQIEDELFRMATYMRRLDLGDAPIDAARIAREQFLDYDIRAPWVNMARRTVLPFISYTYRAVPVVAQSIIHRPWKLAKYFTVAYLANAMAYLLSPGDEDEERRTMRDDQQGYTWIGTPRMLRLPTRDEYGNPVFIDIRRWIPAGDVFDMNQGNSALPIPAPVQFGGPLMLGFEFALNKQAFTGEEIVSRDTDTMPEQIAKTANWLYKSWMPSGAYIPGSYYWDRFWTATDGGRDILGRPYSVPQSLLSSIGIKVQPHDVQLGYEFRSRDLAAQARQIESDMRRAQSDLNRNIINRAEFNKMKDRARKKMLRLQDEQNQLMGR